MKPDFTERAEELFKALSSYRHPSINTDMGSVEVWAANQREGQVLLLQMALEGLYSEIHKQADYEFRMDELEAVMISIDKWFAAGDPVLKLNPATRAAEAREALLRLLEEKDGRIQSLERQVKKLSLAEEAPVPVSHLGLSTRALGCMARNSIKTVAELITKTEDDLARTNNCGHGTLAEIKAALEARGLSLKPYTWPKGHD